MKHALALLVALFLPVQAAAVDCVAKVVARLGSATTQDADAVIRFAATIDDQSRAADGLLAVLDVFPTDGPLRARQILDHFVEAQEAVFGQLSLVRHVEGFDQLAIALAKGDLEAQGSAVVLFYATTKMNLADVARFEVPIPNSLRRADLQDVAGNLIEGKAHNWSQLPEFLVMKSFEDIRKQGEVFQQHAAAEGKQFVLLFGESVPPQFTSLLNQILGPLLSKPNVVFINGV